MKEKFDKEIKMIEEALEKREFNNIFFVACGGSMAALTPGQYFISKEIDIPTFIYTSNEFVHKKPKMLGEKSLVITRSHSGETPETVKAAELAKNKGAFTIAISMEKESSLCKASDYSLTYEYGPDIEISNGDYATYWRLIFKLMYKLNLDEKYERGYKAIELLGEAFKINKEQNRIKADEFGRHFKREKLIYTMASGEYYSIAYSFTSCLLMEMLWINSNAIHCGEYFHGPFEVTDYDVPFLIIRGIGATRNLDDRAIDFAKKFSKEVYIMNVEDFDLSMFDEDLKEYFAVPICSAVIRLYADGLSEHTGHPLSVRRYMWKMEY